MSTEVSVNETTDRNTRPSTEVDQEAVAGQLQRLYEHILADRRPEAVSSTEVLADQLGVEIERPDRFPARRG